MLIRGDRLNATQRRMVLERYPYRWTKDNPRRKLSWTIKGVCPHCDMDTIVFERVECRQYHPTIALISDEQWLAEHAFHFTKDGSQLMVNRHYAEPAFLAD